MAKQNGKVPGIYVSESELNDLGELLTTLRDYIISHEARLEAIEEYINELIKSQLPEVPEDESPDDSEEG